MRKQTKLWTTKDKSKIRICDMADQHLINTISMLERMAEIKHTYDVDWMSSLICMLSGEMAMMAAESEFDNLVETGPEPEGISPLYYDLVEEKRRREIVNEIRHP